MPAGRKLLLADDSIAIQKVVALTFADEGFEVTTVDDGEQAIKKLEEITPDIVLADVFMPGRNGYEVCEWIKQDARLRHIPVMLLVGTFEPFDEAEARRVGADDVLTKPFQSIRELVNKVGTLLGSRPSEEEGLKAQEEEPTAAATLPIQMGISEAEQQQQRPNTTESDTNRLTLDNLSGAQKSAYAETNAYALADIDTADDQMIEVTPASEFGTAAQAAPTKPLTFTDLTEESLLDFDYPETSAQKPSSHITTARTTEGGMLDAEAESQQPFNASLLATQDDAMSLRPVANDPGHGDGAVDDALLDLGDVEFSSPTAEADDHILDFDYETPKSSLATSDEESSTDVPALFPVDEESASIAAGDFDIRQASDERRAEAFSTQELAQSMEAFGIREPGSEILDASSSRRMSPGAAFERETSIVEEPTQTGSSAFLSEATQTANRKIGLDQLSPEVIDAVARRVVEQLSEKVIREIAWEVVPELAELMIKRRLDEERSRTP